MNGKRRFRLQLEATCIWGEDKEKKKQQKKEEANKKETHMMKRRRECFQTTYLKSHQTNTASLERCSLSLALSN